MRVLYVDTSLEQTLGHHYNVALSITDALKRQGHQVELGVSQRARDVPGHRQFRHAVYAAMGWDPTTARGRLRLARSASKTTNGIWDLLGEFNPDLVYAHSANAFVCEGILTALSGVFEPKRAPVFVAELPYPSEPKPGYYYGEQLAGFSSTIQRRSRLQGRFVPVTVNGETSRILSSASGLEVGTMPSPYSAKSRRPAPPAAKSPLRIGCLGHQKKSKGFHLLPGIINKLTGVSRPLEVVVQVQPGNMDDITEVLQHLNMGDQSIRLVDEDMDNDAYFDLMRSIDIVLLPYEPSRYISAISGIAYEALALGNVIVAPSETTVGTIIKTYQHSAKLFSDWSEASISDTVKMAIEEYQGLACEAAEASDVYRTENGPDVFAAELSRIVGDSVSLQKRSPAEASAKRAIFAMKGVALDFARLAL